MDTEGEREDGVRLALLQLAETLLRHYNVPE